MNPYRPDTLDDPPRKRHPIRIIIAAIVLAYCAGAVTASITLNTTACSTVQPGQDALLVRAEQTEKTAFSIMDTFVTIEDQNQALLEAKLPGIHAAAEKIRREGKPAIRALHNAIDAYRKNPDAPALIKALSVVESLSNDAQSWIAKSQGGA